MFVQHMMNHTRIEQHVSNPHGIFFGAGNAFFHQLFDRRAANKAGGVGLGRYAIFPITDVENIARYFAMRILPPRQSVLRAVQEVRPALNLIDHYKPAETAEGEPGIGEACKIGRVLEIEALSGHAALVQNVQGQGRFP